MKKQEACESTHRNGDGKKKSSVLNVIIVQVSSNVSHDDHGTTFETGQPLASAFLCQDTVFSSVI